jgi:hypothetical protein
MITVETSPLHSLTPVARGNDGHLLPTTSWFRAGIIRNFAVRRIKHLASGLQEGFWAGWGQRPLSRALADPGRPSDLRPRTSLTPQGSDPQNIYGFRPTLGALRRGSLRLALALTCRCSLKYRYACNNPAAMCTMSSSPVEGVGAENRFLHSRLGVSPRQDASEEAVRSTSSVSVKVSCLF